MEEQSLALSFGNSMTEDVASVVGEYAELGLDALVEDGLFKDIPVVSTAVAIYKIGKSVHEKYHITKLIAFLNEINKGIGYSEKRENYREKFLTNEKFRNQELEYILILIDRYISLDKPQMLAKLYLAYLDGEIIWEEFTMYAEVLDRFLLFDAGKLISSDGRTIVHRNIGGEYVSRLVALGLMTEVTDTSPFVEHGNGNIGITWGTLTKSISTDKVYKRTEFGDKLANILR